PCLSPGAPRVVRRLGEWGGHFWAPAAERLFLKALSTRLRRKAIRGRRLPAILGPRPRILFVRINPSLRSAAVGHHFASPGNPFWRLLHAARLIPTALTHADDGRLPEHGLALTNIVPRATRAASELTRPEFVAG